jgi:hypothetical protein
VFHEGLLESAAGASAFRTAERPTRSITSEMGIITNGRIASSGAPRPILRFQRCERSPATRRANRPAPAPRSLSPSRDRRA